jgi:hypothetical protein
LIIGAQRCGTTSLFYYLAGHPQVATPRTKEIHFFDLQYERGLDWYVEHFAGTTAEPDKRVARVVRGEASPYYIFHPHAVSRIRKDLPDVKLIALLRNPVDRAYSHYWHQVRLGNEHLPFEAAIANEPKRLAGEMQKVEDAPSYKSDVLVRHSYLMRGIYADQLPRLFRHFPRSQVEILKSEDLFADPQGVFAHVTDFLGLERCPIANPENMTAVTEGTAGDRPPRMRTETRTRLLEYFRGHNERLYALLGRDFGWEEYS